MLLEQKHTAGLLSVTAGIGTVEASLHDRIEHVLSVSMFFPTRTLYAIASQIAVFENGIEERLEANCARLEGEDMVRERVVYIDARSAFFYLLWILVVRDWTQAEKDKDGGLGLKYVEVSERDVELYYIIATFLSRCRYCQRYGFDSEAKYYAVVRALCVKHGLDAVRSEFERLSNDLLATRAFSLLGWASQEYSLQFEPAEYDHKPSLCSWTDESGQRRQALCDVALG